MLFNGFSQEDFHTFKMDGLETRMNAIKETIQPKFKKIGDIILDEISILTDREMYIHIAKHARRTVNPPNDTWIAFSHDKRGYKKHPHFQIGLFDDRVFVWLSLIYELPNKKEIAQNYISNVDILQKVITTPFHISLNHMKRDSISTIGLSDHQLMELLQKFHIEKKCEFLIGHQIPANDPLLADGEHFLSYVLKTYRQLIPLYQLAFI